MAKLRRRSLAEDEQRVAERLAAALNPLSALSAPPPEAPAIGSPPLAAGMSRWSAWLRRAGWVSLSVTAGGLAGYQLGFQRGELRVPSTPPTVTVRAETSTQPVARADNEILNPLPEDPITVPDDETSNSVTTSVSESTHAAKGRASAHAAARASDDEVYQVQRVERALRQGNAALALSLLQDLQTSFPQGRLHQERTAARCLAHCLLSQPGTERELQSFEQQYPNSVHLNRLRQACARK